MSTIPENVMYCNKYKKLRVTGLLLLPAYMFWAASRPPEQYNEMWFGWWLLFFILWGGMMLWRRGQCKKENANAGQAAD
jgi:hypothetical protein